MVPFILSAVIDGLSSCGGVPPPPPRRGMQFSKAGQVSPTYCYRNWPIDASSYDTTTAAAPGAMRPSTQAVTGGYTWTDKAGRTTRTVCPFRRAQHSCATAHGARPMPPLSSPPSFAQFVHIESGGGGFGGLSALCYEHAHHGSAPCTTAVASAAATVAAAAAA
ncbi:hypothetical protein JKP88DRAFT_234707 [Tribonema minus]|uniref:Uncharacterized protein n=1 Tax=Tribonema minus TaxID=303371 RepID=A0A835Z7W3_9STRA|nr:hypothetical protein JKP88DRAFT_234707 [Tribonema minus]